MINTGLLAGHSLWLDMLKLLEPRHVYLNRPHKSLTGNLPLHLAARSSFLVTSNKLRGKEREKCVGQDSHSWPVDVHFGMSAVGNVGHVCASSDKGGSISYLAEPEPFPSHFSLRI